MRKKHLILRVRLQSPAEKTMSVTFLLRVLMGLLTNSHSQEYFKVGRSIVIRSLYSITSYKNSFTSAPASSQAGKQYTESTAAFSHGSCDLSYKQTGEAQHLRSKHVPEERTHGAWKNLHRLDLVTSGTHAGNNLCKTAGNPNVHWHTDPSMKKKKEKKNISWALACWMVLRHSTLPGHVVLRVIPRYWQKLLPYITARSLTSWKKSNCKAALHPNWIRWNEWIHVCFWTCWK